MTKASKIKRPSFTFFAKKRHQRLKKAKKQAVDNCHRLPYKYIATQLERYMNGQLSRIDFLAFIKKIYTNDSINEDLTKINILFNDLDSNKIQVSEFIKQIISILNSASPNLNPGDRRTNRRIGARLDLSIKNNSFTPNSKKILKELHPTPSAPIPCDNNGRVLSSRTINTSGNMGSSIDPNELTPESKLLFDNHNGIGGSPSKQLF